MMLYAICVTHRIVTFGVGAAFGDVGVSLVVAGAAFDDVEV